ncbi:MAG: S8 family serine peptidase [Cytophagales bacterium]|nr:S8 family serine peptidase [Cytophagales bacterium]
MSIDLLEALEGISEIWARTKGDTKVSIAVLDGPVDLAHKTLKASDLKSLDPPSKKKVYSSHGTFVASLIFGNHDQIKGIAPNCSGVTKTIFKEEENGNLQPCSQTDIEQGILAALASEADIINISGGEKLQENEKIIYGLARALDECEKRGVLVVAATGNDGDRQLHVPAKYQSVLAVGSIRQDGIPSDFSNWDLVPNQGLVVPGENIIGAIPDNGKAIATGTSFSTALVSGIAALLASLQVQTGQEKDLRFIRQVLLDSIKPCTKEQNICQRLLNGNLDIRKAMDKVLQPSIKSNTIIEESYKIHPESNTNPSSVKERSKQIISTSTSNNHNMNTNDQNSEHSSLHEETSNVAQHQNESSMTNSPVEENEVATMPSNNLQTPSNGTFPSSTMERFNAALNPGDFPTFQNSQLVNCIGQPSYDFGRQNNMDTFTAYIRAWYESLPDEVDGNRSKSIKTYLTDSPHDHKTMAAFLLYHDGIKNPNILMASQLIWLLNLNETPTYSISPEPAVFSDEIYARMAEFLADNAGIDAKKYITYTSKINQNKLGSTDCDPTETSNLKDILDTKNDLMRMVLPGYISGQTRLMNGNSIESVTPVAFGLYNWSLKELIKGTNQHSTEANTSIPKVTVEDVLNRLYVETLNRGQSPEDRALNYALYNIITISNIVEKSANQHMQFSHLQVVPSRISRQNALLREVQLTFFNPDNTNHASRTHSMQVDVSGIVPVIVGDIQSWSSPVSVIHA